MEVEASWNVMAHAQETDFVFRWNGRVHLNRRWRQFSRLLAAEVCASAVVMLDTPCSEVVWRVLATHSIRQFPLHFPSRASPCAITFQLESTTSQHQTNKKSVRSSLRSIGYRINYLRAFFKYTPPEDNLHRSKRDHLYSSLREEFYIAINDVRIIMLIGWKIPYYFPTGISLCNTEMPAVAMLIVILRCVRKIWNNLPTWCNWVFICVLSARHVWGLYAHFQEQWMLKFLYIAPEVGRISPKHVELKEHK